MKMAEREIPESLLYSVFPEFCPKNLLLKTLKDHGISEELLSGHDDNTELVCQCFYKSVASLPRRKPPQSRRGDWMSKCQKLETKNHILEVNHSNKLDCKYVKTVDKSSAVATPEMDRLLARSQAAKKNLLNCKRPSRECDSSAKIAKPGHSAHPNKTALTSAVDVKSCSRNIAKTSVVSIQSTKQPTPPKSTRRIKLKRPSFAPSSLQSVKVSKVD